MTPTIVQIVIEDTTGDTHHRFLWPAQQLAQQRPDWRILNLHASAAERFELALEADLLVLFQSVDLDLLPILDARRLKGRKTLVEFNDNFYAPPPSSPAYFTWTSPLVLETYEQFLHAADGLIVTGAGLRELFASKTTLPIHILKNHYPHQLKAPEELLSQKHQSRRGTVRIGWAGSLGHAADILAVAPVLQRLVAENRELSLCFMGNRALGETLGIPKDRIEITDWSDVDSYFAWWRSVDIGIATNLDTAYNRCRSDIKAVEMSAGLVAPVLSHSPIYADFVQATGVPEWRTHAELYNQLRSLVYNENERMRRATTCYDYVARDRLGARRDERAKLYASVLPASSASYQWQVPNGFHSLAGTQGRTTAFQELRDTVETLLSQGNYSSALERTHSAVAANKRNFQVRLVHVNALIAAQMYAEASAESRRARLDFPNDPRFLFAEINLESDDAQRHTLWTTALERLRKGGRSYQHHFEREILHLCIRSVQRRHLRPTALDELLEIYPSRLPLLFARAEYLKEVGQRGEAVRCLESILESYDQVATNQEFTKHHNFAFISALAGAWMGEE